MDLNHHAQPVDRDTARQEMERNDPVIDQFPSQTSEFLPVPVSADGVIVTTGIAYSVVPNGNQPGAWTAATVMNSKTGVMVSGFAAGTYRIYAQATTTNETAVIDCGTFLVV